MLSGVVNIVYNTCSGTILIFSYTSFPSIKLWYLGHDTSCRISSISSRGDASLWVFAFCFLLLNTVLKLPNGLGIIKRGIALYLVAVHHLLSVDRLFSFPCIDP